VELTPTAFGNHVLPLIGMFICARKETGSHADANP
jgi:hypothetical protein